MFDSMLSRLNDLFIWLGDVIWGWPLVIYILATSIIVTGALRVIQVRYFFAMWRTLFASREHAAGASDMTPIQAFLNALSASVGNGSIAGMATAVAAGGPGAAFWVFVLGILSMSLRFAEVFLSTAFPITGTAVFGGPMIYLQHVPGRSFLPYVYAFFCLMLGFVVGCGMQANSIGLSIERSVGIAPIYMALILALFIAYVVLGGASRIVQVSDAIVPVKVGVFFVATIAALIYHYAALVPALLLIAKSAFMPQAILGGAVGYSVQQAMRFGFSRVSNASEAGLGTAAIFFGATGSKDAVKDSVMAMLSTFISANLVCFSVALLLVASGMWNTGLTSTPLTSAAYETVFGVYGGYIVSFLSASFGLGVMVAYAYITRSCWLFLTSGRYVGLFNMFYCLFTFLGPIAKVDIVWNSADLINAGLLAMNLYAILWLLPLVKKGVHAYERQ